MRPDRASFAFLVSIGTLPLACFQDKGPATGSGTTGDDTTTGTPPTGVYPDFDTSSESGGDTGTRPPACDGYYDLLLECYVEGGADYAEYGAEYCESLIAKGLEGDGQVCADAIAAVYVCLSSLTCEEFYNPSPECEESFNVSYAVCPTSLPGGDSTGGETTGTTGDSTGEATMGTTVGTMSATMTMSGTTGP